MVEDGAWVKNVCAAGGEAYLISGRRPKVRVLVAPVRRSSICAPSGAS